MIAVIDYGMGNLRSVQKAFEHVEAKAVIVDRPEDIDAAERVVLPGVGAFGDAMNNLRTAGLIAPIIRAISEGRPFLGICLGLQLMFAESEEMGRHKGLDILPGKVKRFPEGQRVPQIGWNEVQIQRETALLDGVPDRSYFYFVHSFFVASERDEDVVGVTDYGIDYASIAGNDRAFGVQFHPEKSQDAGLKILKNFAEKV
ncbi:MAG: imidazole glycerol phosphate synthase subunit HisH [Gemmatimonadetes bacterium]|nr:imidazole glycerol phosphate synthase subunit HisH [Gemmatimonadota bacterium]MYF74024.1 imidazole glycerol phosphate synthase subunit HisH [Gemmatimonadota bacterium]MYK54193.1 imidazole glycerol phosphate synthase subunit HisH [Gemmatimonadota bacterium]